MYGKILNLLLILTSLLGYLEWGINSHSFLVQAEIEVLSGMFSNPASVLHPLVILPLIGQVLLLFSLFQKRTDIYITYIGIATLGLLLGFMFIAGVISGNFKIMVSVIPFIVVSFLTIKHHRTQSPVN